LKHRLAKTANRCFKSQIEHEHINDHVNNGFCSALACSWVCCRDGLIAESGDISPTGEVGFERCDARRMGRFTGNSGLFRRLSADPSSDLNYPDENPGQCQKQQYLYQSAQGEEST
jgi:hypothetical protein